MSPAEAAVPAFDALCHRRRITGYTVEGEATYLAPAGPTLTYRMYRDAAGLRHAARFEADMTSLGARTRRSLTVGNLHLPRGIHRTEQVTVMARFATAEALGEALALVRRRYHAAGAQPVPGSWWLPDVRLTGCPALPGTLAVTAQSMLTPRGVAVTLTADAHPVLPELRSDRVHVLDDWSGLLGQVAA